MVSAVISAGAAVGSVVAAGPILTPLGTSAAVGSTESTEVVRSPAMVSWTGRGRRGGVGFGCAGWYSGRHSHTGAFVEEHLRKGGVGGGCAVRCFCSHAHAGTTVEEKCLCAARARRSRPRRCDVFDATGGLLGYHGGGWACFW